MSIQQGQEIKFTSDVASHGSYRMSRVLPLGSASVTLNATSTSETQIEIPTKVFNLAKSSLDFLVSCPIVTNQVTNLHALGDHAIDRISAYSREGVFLCDLVNFAPYSRAMYPYLHKQSELLTKDSMLGGATAAAAQAKDKGHGFFPSNAAAASTQVAHTPNAKRLTAALDDGAADRAYVEPQYVTCSTDNTASAFNVSIPFSSFKHSILAMDKDLYFGQSIILRIHWNSVNKLGWSADTIDDYATGAADLASAVTVTNIRVYLAIENNPVIVQSLVQRVRSQGMELTIPYVYSYLFNSASGTSSNVQQRLNAGHGQRLLSVYHVVSDTTATGRDAVNITNVADDKVVSSQASLDNVNLSEFRPAEAQGESYVLLKPILEGSAVASKDIYDYNRVHVNTWRSGRMCDYSDNDSAMVMDGLSLDSERIWNLEQTTASAAYRQYSFFVVQRQLRIQPDGLISLQ